MKEFLKYTLEIVIVMFLFANVSDICCSVFYLFFFKAICLDAFFNIFKVSIAKSSDFRDDNVKRVESSQ